MFKSYGKRGVREFMLVCLEIRDFGLIEQISLEFTSGLNVLTGETGAGKSIIIDALQVVLGQRASSELIRTSREKARITAIFDIKRVRELKQKLNEWGVPVEEDESLIMSRELARNGRNVCRLNGQVVSLGIYREAGRLLVDLQGQHEQQSLLSREHQLELLDRFGGFNELCSKVREIYRFWRKANERLEELNSGAKDRARRLDMLRYQVEEIEKAKLSPEEEGLLKERTRLANAEKITSLIEDCYSCLQGDERNSFCALDLLGRTMRNLSELSRLDETTSSFLASFENAFYQIQELAHELVDYREKIQSDPEQLQLIEERLSLIKNLKRKYGDSINEILNYRKQAAKEIEDIINYEENSAALEVEIAGLNEVWWRVAQELTAARKAAACKLEEAVAAELAHLEMGRINFCVSFEQLSELSPNGQERVEMLISPNPGEPLRPMAKIASGGELSRIMLAVRTILAATDEVPTLVFDEVDAGIGGKTLQAVAEKLARIAKHSQVICVTHAAQVACYADTHYYIFKEVKEEKACICADLLQDEMRLKEIARMLAGGVDGLAKEHAQQMLKRAKNRMCG